MSRSPAFPKPSAPATIFAAIFLLGLVLVSIQSAEKAKGTSGGNPYTAPLAEDVSAQPNLVEAFITAKKAKVDIGNGVMADAFTFNGQIPGPEFRLNVGQDVLVHFKNELDEPTGIHWHGIQVNNANDGTPLTQNLVPPGGTFLYKFRIVKPGIFWYHPHHHSSTNQVFKGMYGAVIVEDPNEDELINTGILPDEELTRTLVLSDVTVCKAPGSNDSATYDPSMPHVTSATPLPAQAGPFPTTLCDTPIDQNGDPIGQALPAGAVPNIQPKSAGRVNEGQTVLTNGKNVGGRSGTSGIPGPLAAGAATIDVFPGTLFRLRLVNAATTRYFRLRFVNANGVQADTVRIGGEGGLLNRAKEEGNAPFPGVELGYHPDEILLAPGQRADVVLEIPVVAGVATLWTQDFKRTGLGEGWANIPDVPVAHFNVVSSGSAGLFLADGEPLRTATGDEHEFLGQPFGAYLNPASFGKPGLQSSDIKLTQVAQTGLGVDNIKGTHDLPGDYSAFPHENSARYAKLGDTLDLTVTNNTAAHHPFHLHGFSFQPTHLQMPGDPTIFLGPEFVDTFDIPGNSTLTYKVKLEDRPLMNGLTLGGGTGRWVLHCHIFFHAVFGMISELVVTDQNGNERPLVNATSTSVTVFTGQQAETTGTFSDPDADLVTLTASTGSVVPTGGGTWQWSKTAGAGDSGIVYITATDDNGLKSQAAFELNVKPPPPPNLSIAKDCTPDVVQPGGSISCTITVTNPGPGTALNPRVTDDLPAGVTVIGTPAGAGFNCVKLGTSPEITCSSGPRPPGTAVITYTARIPNAVSPGQQFTNTAAVSTNPPDPVASNNAASHTVAIPSCTRAGGGLIQGTPGNDVICGSSGGDNINAGGGNDLVFARGGNDLVGGGPGSDNILGEAGNDTITGGDGTDRADGGTGTDKCTAEAKISCES